MAGKKAAQPASEEIRNNLIQAAMNRSGTVAQTYDQAQL